MKQIGTIILVCLSLSIVSACKYSPKYILLNLKDKKVKTLNRDLIIESLTIVSTGPDTIFYADTKDKFSKSIFLDQNYNFKAYFFDSLKFMDTVEKDYSININCLDLETNQPRFFIEHYRTNKLFSIKEKIRSQGRL